jgi:ubiquinone/menaquinone biosynthesis C-methylase UbiE
MTDQTLLELLAAEMRGVGEPLGALLHAYGPQMGEMVWHSIHHDPRIDSMVQAQGAVMRDIIARHGLRPPQRPIRILEVGAYSHYTVHAVAAESGGIGVANDISPAALRAGASLARARGIPVADTLVASDFHDLPFADGFFDLVFIASAVHHTFRPWRVLDELFRVLRPGGVLHI